MRLSLSILSRCSKNFGGYKSVRYKNIYRSPRYSVICVNYSSRMSNLKNEDLDLYYDTVMNLVKNAGEVK